ncbi:MAG: ribose 5-phosphate isomerase B [Saprospiraceae bacterium]|nr:MAG: ribose 5-phosphate isomerase B [Saprospiraceae bacterium]
MEIKTIAIGCDHAGFPYKDSIVELLESRGIKIRDYGTNSTAAVDYPDFVHPVATTVENGEAEFGIVLCGSGNGASMTANKHKGIRCALCWSVEIASLARQHNNANILSIPVRFVSEAEALAMVNAFLKVSFEGGRHARRIDKIPCA